MARTTQRATGRRPLSKAQLSATPSTRQTLDPRDVVGARRDTALVDSKLSANCHESQEVHQTRIISS